MRNYQDEIPWAKISHHQDFKRGHYYEAVDNRKVVGSLRYIKGFPKPDVITIHELTIDPDYQQRGVGIALLHRLHEDNPEHLIDPGHPNEEAYAFIEEIWENEPRVAQFAHFHHPDAQKRMGVKYAHTQTR